jgi:hypothetical protein
MAAWTLAQLTTRAQQEADAGTDPNGFVPTATWTDWANSGISRVYRKLVSKFGDNYYFNTVIIQGVQGTSSYPLPNGVLYSAAPAFYKMVGVSVSLGNNASNWINALPYQIKQRNMYSGFYFPIAVVSPWLARYQIQGNNLNWIPATTAPGPVQFKLDYVPQPPILVNQTDTFDGIAGWEEAVVCDMVLRYKDKSESDATVIQARYQDWMKQIEDEADNRDAAEPLRKVDTRSMDMGIGGVGSWGGTSSG